MKLLFVWHAAVEKEYRMLFREIAASGVDLTVITVEKWFESSKLQRFQRDEAVDGRYRIYSLKTIFVNHIRSFFFLNIFRLVKILLKTGPEFIYIKEEPFSSVCFEITLLCRLFAPKAKLTVESDENLPVRHHIPFTWFEKFVLKSVERINVVSEDGIAVYKGKGAGDKLFKTSYFVNTEKFKPAESKEFPEAFPGMNKFKIKIGFAGRLTEEKGIDTLVLSMNYIKNPELSFALFIAGSGDENYLKFLKELILKENLQERVFFLGSLETEKLPLFYNILDVLVLPSKTMPWWKEQFGRVIIESQACGTPVIGSSSGEIPRIVGENRLIFPEGDAGSLGTILGNFTSGKWNKKDFSDKCIKRVSELYSYKAVAENKLKSLG